MDRFWPSSFPVFAQMDQEKVEAHKHRKKRPISGHLDPTNLANKGFYLRNKEHHLFSVIPRRQDSANLCTLVA